MEQHQNPKPIHEVLPVVIDQLDAAHTVRELLDDQAVLLGRIARTHGEEQTLGEVNTKLLNASRNLTIHNSK